MAARGQIQPVEQALLRNWPSLETIVDGDWVWRFAKGYTGRANSLVCLDPADNHDVAKRLATHFERSRKYKIIPRVRITPLAAPEIIELLDEDGWTRQGNTRVMLMPLTARKLPHAGPSKVLMLDPGSKDWPDAIAPLLGLESGTAATYAQMMQKMPASAQGFIIAGENQEPACAMLGAVFNGVGNVFGLTTKPWLRRRGLGRELMIYGLEWMKNNGASCAVVQVVADNKEALSLYHSLGFEIAYSYHYRILPENA